jgi:hypothetical protein
MCAVCCARDEVTREDPLGRELRLREPTVAQTLGLLDAER